MKQHIDTLLRSYETALIWGGKDQETALHEAIDAAFSMMTEERRAELYARLMDGWNEHPVGVLRRIYVRNVVERWNIDHVFAPEIAKARAAFADAMGDEGDDTSGVAAILARLQKENGE